MLEYLTGNLQPEGIAGDHNLQSIANIALNCKTFFN